MSVWVCKYSNEKTHIGGVRLTACFVTCAACPTHITNHRPKQKWRGMLLDTSRHFYPPPVIARLLDAMAMNHMNVLHWHMTDDQV